MGAKVIISSYSAKKTEKNSSFPAGKNHARSKDFVFNALLHSAFFLFNFSFSLSYQETESLRAAGKRLLYEEILLKRCIDYRFRICGTARLPASHPRKYCFAAAAVPASAVERGLLPLFFPGVGFFLSACPDQT